MGTGGRLHLGPMTMYLQNLPLEIRIAIERRTDPLESAVDIAVPDDSVGDLLSADNLTRFGLSEQPSEVIFRPLLADRAVVAAPRKPFFIPAQQSATVYVSTPLWIAVAPDDHSTLEEIPIFRPSKSWFGTDTQIGEVCYFSHTACRLRLDEVKRRPHRAITAVHVVNNARSELYLDRMKVPVPFLALYSSDDGGLWTQDVRLERNSDDPAQLQLGQGKPRDANKAAKVAEPRETIDANVVFRAFGSLVGKVGRVGGLLR
jgi:hypothetical protein